jgi:hypothetical protein
MPAPGSYPTDKTIIRNNKRGDDKNCTSILISVQYNHPTHVSIYIYMGAYIWYMWLTVSTAQRDAKARGHTYFICL